MFRNKVPQQGAALAPDSVSGACRQWRLPPVAPAASGARQWRNIATEHCCGTIITRLSTTCSCSTTCSYSTIYRYTEIYKIYKTQRYTIYRYTDTQKYRWIVKLGRYIGKLLYMHRQVDIYIYIYTYMFRALLTTRTHFKNTCTNTFTDTSLKPSA